MFAFIKYINPRTFSRGIELREKDFKPPFPPETDGYSGHIPAARPQGILEGVGIKITRGVFCGVVFAVASVFLLGNVRAQTLAPVPLLSWRAATYAPSSYEGRVLPTTDSEISVWLDLINNGRSVDLAQYPIRWLVNGRFVRGGTGMTNFAVQAKNVLGRSTIQISAEVLNYGTKTLTGGVSIPVAAPAVALVAPYPEGRVGGSFSVEAIPYFFNVKSISSLLASWKVNGVEPENYADPFLLRINIPPGTTPGARITVESALKNPASLFENASAKANFEYRP